MLVEGGGEHIHALEERLVERRVFTDALELEGVAERRRRARGEPRERRERLSREAATAAAARRLFTNLKHGEGRRAAAATGGGDGDRDERASDVEIESGAVISVLSGESDVLSLVVGRGTADEAHA